MRTALFALFHAAFLGVTVLVAPARGQVGPALRTVAEVPLPGGIRAAQAAIGDRANPDRAQFLADFIRRIYDTPLGAKADARDPVLEALLAQLKSATEPAEMIPLPLSMTFWIDTVFRKGATADTLVASIIGSRNAALLYRGLLALDDETRAWFGTQPGLISDIVVRRGASFATVAAGLRIKAGVVQVPGGAAAEPLWHALTGRRPTEANEFVRSLISSDEGRLAFFFAAIAQLTAPQIRFALSLDATDAGRRVDGARHLYSVFEHLWIGRALEQRVFVRPSYDPALLISELNPSGDGAVTLPGTRGLWTAVFSEAHQTATKTARPEPPATIPWDQSPDFPWLCEQIFKGDASEHRRRFMMVLFASRYAAAITKETARDAVEAIRAAGDYPVLSATLERAGVADLTVFAAATRRAAALTAIEDQSRAARALAQYQGALAMITRAATRGSVGPDGATNLVSTLAAIPVTERGDYEGRVVVWLGNWLDPAADPARKPRPSGPAADGSVEEHSDTGGGAIEDDALRILSGPQAPTPRTLEWEGTRYRVDFPRAEAFRVTQAQGDSSRPYLSWARTVLSSADALAAAGLTPATLQQQAQVLARLSHAETPEQSELSASDVLAAHRQTANGLQRAARAGDLTAAAKLAPALRLVADDLLARGLMEWTYAAALGPLDGISPTAAEAAARHDFGLRSVSSRWAVWQQPTEGSDPIQGWRVLGSLLGLDVTLARFSLVRLSMKPPSMRPMLGELDRRVFVEAVALIEPRSLTDADRDTIAASIRNGRARLNGAIQSPDDVAAIADAVSLHPQRRTLLAWTIAHDPSRVGAFLSPAELFWLGAGEARIAALDAWGVPATSRIGCLCLRVGRAHSWDMFAGRWNTGMVASAFPDLNFRLGELLSDLHMPAALLAPVLTSATLDFVNSAVSRDQDDRRGLVEFVQALQPDRVEQYLALLTTDGPLVPVSTATTGKDIAHIHATMESAGKKR